MDFDKVFYDTKDFKITDTKLGKGVFGAVYIAERKSDHRRFAAKVLDILTDIDGKDQMMIMRESVILSSLNHQSIIKFYGLNFRSLRDMRLFQPTIITEYMPNKSLKEMLDKEKIGLSDHNWSPTKKYISLLGIANAMKYLHERDILHRDLKPENILMDENYYPKVCDFGLSRCLSKLLSSSMQKSLTGKIGTPLYMAPELLDDDDENSNEYGKGVDVYAFAILAYEIVTGKLPYYELGEKIPIYKLHNKVMKGGRPTFTDDVPKQMQDLISRCWSQKPKNRPSFKIIFDLLSKDFEYSPECVDEEEVNDFLESLKENQANFENYSLISNCLNIEKNQFQNIKDANNFFQYICTIGNSKILEYLLSTNSFDINAKVISNFMYSNEVLYEFFKWNFLKYS